MLQVKPARFGDLDCKLMHFENAGDVLAKHVHTHADVHVTIVTQGRLRAASHDWSIDLEAGQVADFRADEPHELTALEDDTKIINIIKHFTR